ncbi:hypothetical protein EJB05_52445, partial [Eragrostis curvula]
MKPISTVRDWAALPRDVLFVVFLKLGPTEIMLGAEHACTAWRRVALEEPSLWRCIGWRTIDEIMQRCHISVAAEMALARLSLARAQGQCEAFEGYLNYEFMPYLVERAPSLKTLDINEFRGYDEGTRELIAACPNLKKLVLMYASRCDLECNEDEFNKEPIDGEIPVMHELRTLELYECDLTARGLNSILDSCPLLESLYITGYFNKKDINKELRVKCARVKNLALPTRSKPSDECYYDYVGYSESEDDYEE